jgi:aminoglycoside phosphotransferase (APT) family kinase protein
MAVFLLKADIDLADDVLHALRAADSSDRPPDAAVVTTSVRRVTGSNVVRVGRAVRGTFRWVVFADLEPGLRVAVRVNRLAHPHLVDGLERETALTPLLRAGGVPVPAVLGADLEGQDAGAPFVVVERVAGRTLAAIDDDSAVAESAVLTGLKNLGATLRVLHSTQGSGAGPISTDRTAGIASHPTGLADSWGAFIGLNLDRHLEACVAAGVLASADASRAAALCSRTIDPAVDTGRLLHGDPGGHNVVLGPGGEVNGLVDWEDALVGDPVFDVASAALFQPERRWSALFEGYWASPTLPPDSAERFWQYQLRIAIARTVVRARLGLSDRPDREPAATRLHRAIAELGGERA